MTMNTNSVASTSSLDEDPTHSQRSQLHKKIVMMITEEDDGGVSTSSFEEDAAEPSTEEIPVPTKEERPALAHRENLAVNRSKLLVYAVLLLTAAGAAFGTYYFVDDAEQKEFKKEVSPLRWLAD